MSLKHLFPTVAIILALPCFLFARENPELVKYNEQPPLILEVEDVVCSVGAVQNRISNSTHERATGSNDWTILIGDDSAELPSMLWTVPEQYPDNHYLYFASLRVGYNGHQIMLAADTTTGSPGIDVLEPPQSLSDFDTHCYLTDTLGVVPEENRVGIQVDQNTYAWSEEDANDFIIYEYWIKNLTFTARNDVYVALHADCDVSTAEGGTGALNWSRDDLVSYYRDDISKEYISYMYDGDCPEYPGNDIGGRRTPKESAGYIGSRLLYCPPRMGETESTIQSGHGWWDWNSDPSPADAFADWYDIMSDGIWMDDPPSPHDFRFLQKTGPFSIPAHDSIKVVFAFGIGEGLSGMRSNLNNAALLYQNDYVYFDLPPATPLDFGGSSNGNGLDFAWRANTESDLAGYNIFMSANAEGPFQLINGSPIADNQYSYTPLQRGLYYCYIQAIDNADNESLTSDTIRVSNLPFPPSDVRIISGNNSLTLYWNEVPGADNYRIYRSDVSGGPYSLLTEISPGTGEYTDNTVTNYQTYYYVMTTMDDGFESPQSGEVQAAPRPSDTDNGRVLLVDDYADRDANGNQLDYQIRRRFYERWGVYNFDYDVWSIADSGMVDSTTILNYQAVLFASDGELGQSDFSWWYYVGDVGGGALRYYLENGGHLLAIGQLILLDLSPSYPPDVHPGYFEYDWLGIDSTDWCFDYWSDFTWAVGAEPGYPDSMKIDVAKNSDQVDYAMEMSGLRTGVDTLFTWGLNIDGNETYAYQKPLGIIYRPGGEAVTSLLSFSMYYMPHEPAHLTMNNILRDEFGCTFYNDPPPLPPWELQAEALAGDSIKLIWDPIDETDVTAINVYRAIFDGPFELAATLDPSVGVYLDTDITAGTEYNYRLSCTDFAGQEGRYSHTVTEYGGRPQTPGDLDSNPSDNMIELTWINPFDPLIDHFAIYKKAGLQQHFQLLAEVANNQSSYQDDDVLNLHGYEYYMTSISIYDIESYPSDTIFAMPYQPGNRTGILVVNGCDWPTYGDEIVDFYQNEVPSGYQTDYRIWDLFDNAPANAFPDSNKFLGHGDMPADLFEIFAKIVWVGNEYNGDFEYWLNNEANIMNCLNTGGSLLLMTRYGGDFFFNDLHDWCGVTSFESGPTITELTSVNDSLSNISASGIQSLADLVVSSNPNTIQLYEVNNLEGGGFFTQGPSQSGNFAYIAGRPYRYDYDDLKANVDVVLRYFLETPTYFDQPGSVSGVVTDADTDLPIEGVHVEALNAGIHDSTNSSGEYSLPGLYAGDYEISFAHDDYTDIVVADVAVAANTNTSLDVEMHLGPDGYAYLPGDANMYNGSWPPAVIGSDVTYLVNYFRGVETNPSCQLNGFYASADINASCTVIGSDVTRLVQYFRGAGTIQYCPDYEPLWHNTDELPEDEPSGWPNCEPPMVTGKIVPGASSIK